MAHSVPSTVAWRTYCDYLHRPKSLAGLEPLTTIETILDLEFLKNTGWSMTLQGDWQTLPDLSDPNRIIITDHDRQVALGLLTKDEKGELVLNPGWQLAFRIIGQEVTISRQFPDDYFLADEEHKKLTPMGKRLKYYTSPRKWAEVLKTREENTWQIKPLNALIFSVNRFL